MLKEVLAIASWLSAPVLFIRVCYFIVWQTTSGVPSRRESLLSMGFVMSAFILGALMSPFFSIKPDEEAAKRRSTNMRLWLAGMVYGFVYSLIWSTLLIKNTSDSDWGQGAGMVWIMFLGPSYAAGFTLFYGVWPFISWQWKRFWRSEKGGR